VRAFTRQGGAARGFGARERAALAGVLVVIAVFMLLARLPSTLSGLSAEAKKNDAYGAVGRQLAAADSLDVDNGIVVAGLQFIPRTATFGVVTPTAAAIRSQSIQPLTIEALLPYFRSILLPRVETEVPSAQFIVCYACDVRPWRGRVRWVWNGDNGMKIGRLRRTT
jgi:hypothetical protein